MTETSIEKASSNGVVQVDPMWQLTPSMDLFENGEQYWLLMDMPGVDPATLDVKLIEQELHVRARQSANESRGNLAEFQRVINIPGEIDKESISAEFDNGVLEIKIAKGAASRTVSIPINVN